MTYSFVPLDLDAWVFAYVCQWQKDERVQAAELLIIKEKQQQNHELQMKKIQVLYTIAYRINQ